MTWRLLMRRCPLRSMTLVGDIAQTGALAGAHSWREVLEPVRQGPLAPRGADRQLPDPGPDHGASRRPCWRQAGIQANAPESVREGDWPPSALRVEPRDGATLATRHRRTSCRAVSGGRLAVIVPAAQRSRCSKRWSPVCPPARLATDGRPWTARSSCSPWPTRRGWSSTRWSSSSRPRSTRVAARRERPLRRHHPADPATARAAQRGSPARPRLPGQLTGSVYGLTRTWATKPTRLTSNRPVVSISLLNLPYPRSSNGCLLDLGAHSSQVCPSTLGLRCNHRRSQRLQEEGVGAELLLVPRRSHQPGGARKGLTHGFYLGALLPTRDLRER